MPGTYRIRNLIEGVNAVLYILQRNIVKKTTSSCPLALKNAQFFPLEYKPFRTTLFAILTLRATTIPRFYDLLPDAVVQAARLTFQNTRRTFRR